MCPSHLHVASTRDRRTLGKTTIRPVARDEYRRTCLRVGSPPEKNPIAQCPVQSHLPQRNCVHERNDGGQTVKYIAPGVASPSRR